MALTIDHREADGGIVVISLSGKLMLGKESEQMLTLVSQLIAENHRKILIDMTGITHIDSTGIGRFIASYNKIVNAGGEMRMAGATGHLFHSFKVSLLDQVFPFYPTVEEAARG